MRFFDRSRGKTVTAFADQAAFALYLTALETKCHNSVADAAEAGYNYLQNFVDASASSSSSETKATNTYSCSSTGEGNLTIVGEGKLEDSESTSTYKAAYVFDNYIPVSAHASGTTTLKTSTSEEPTVTSLDRGFDWGKCEPIYLNVADYTSAAA